MKYCHRDQLTAVGLSMSSDNSIQLSFKQTLVSREDNWRERKISMSKYNLYDSHLTKLYFHDCVCWASFSPRFPLEICSWQFYQLKD